MSRCRQERRGRDKGGGGEEAGRGFSSRSEQWRRKDLVHDEDAGAVDYSAEPMSDDQHGGGALVAALGRTREAAASRYLSENSVLDGVLNVRAFGENGGEAEGGIGDRRGRGGG
eukprot:757381-Hanusia_phi.AAC.5